ncbi:MAG: aminopeptidase [Candidatus Omnitrophota bacterium]
MTIKTKAIEAVFKSSLKLRPEESCLIVTDTLKEPIGRAFYEYARHNCARTKLIVMEPTGEHAAEPAINVAHEMLQYDVQLLVTNKSLTHTRARREATSRGARIATMPGITEDIANRCLDVSYKSLRRRSERLYEILKETCEVRVTSKTGTDITFMVGQDGFFGREGGLYDHPRSFGNLPEGEIAFAPTSCSGVYVVDASLADMGILSEPLVFKIAAGVVHEITGRRADELIQRLDSVGSAAYRVAELGIGLNTKARITGNILEDEKVNGTVHMAVGNNLSFGGNNDVPVHLDGVALKPDVYVDGKKLISKGKFLVRYGL